MVAYEHGAARQPGVEFHVLDDDDGTIAAAADRQGGRGRRHHRPAVCLVCVENTHMAAGGRPWPSGALSAVVAAARGIPVHLDGARLFNAEVATGVAVDRLAAPATTVMTCLSKGLGAPVGSLLAGPAEVIAAARVERKRLGGGMRQSGVLAAPGLVALSMVDRLAEDHARAGGWPRPWPRAGPTPGSIPPTCGPTSWCSARPHRPSCSTTSPARGSWPRPSTTAWSDW